MFFFIHYFFQLFVGPREGEDLIRTEDILRIIEEEVWPEVELG